MIRISRRLRLVFGNCKLIMVGVVGVVGVFPVHFIIVFGEIHKKFFLRTDGNTSSTPRTPTTPANHTPEVDVLMPIEVVVVLSA